MSYNAPMMSTEGTTRTMTDEHATDSWRRIVLENALDAVIGIDQQQTIIDWNRQAEVTFGWTKREVMGKLLPEVIIPAKDREAHREGMKRFLATGEGAILNKRIEVEALHRTGNTFPVELTVIPILVEGRYLFYSFLRDITSQKKWESSVRASEERFRVHFEQAPFSIQLLSPDGRTLAVNKAWKELWGVSDEFVQSYILREYNMLNDPQLAAKGTLAYLQKGFAGEPTEIPPILYDPKEIGVEGNPRWVSAFIYPVKDSTGRITEVVLTHEDVTRAKTAEDELRRSRDQLKVMFESVADGILVQDTSYRCVYANESGAQMCGFPSAEAFCNASISELLARFEIQDENGQPLPPERLPARLALSGNKTPPDTVLQVKEKSTGKTTWSVVTSRPVFDPSGKPHLAVSIFRDISAKKQIEQRQKFLSEATQILSSSLDFDETLQQIARLAVPRLADWCSIDLLENNQLRSVAVVHQDPLKIRFAEALRVKFPPDLNSPTGSAKVIRTGESEYFAEIPDELLVRGARSEEHLALIRQLGLRSAMIVPLKAKNRVLGAITFVGAESGRKFSENELQDAEELARRAGLALEHSRLYKATQEALAERDTERKKFETLFEQSPAIMALVRGPDFIFEKTNTAYQELIGHRDVIGKPLVEALPEIKGTPFHDHLKRVFETGEPFHIKEARDVLQKSPGEPPTEVFLDFTYQRVNNPSGEPYGIIGTAIDVTEQVRSRQKVEKLAADLQEAVRARDEFISICSHELKTPITSMKLQFQMASRQIERADPKVHSLESVEKRTRSANNQLDRMIRLIEEMLDVSRISIGRFQMNKEVLDFYDVTRDVIERFSEQFAALGINLKFNGRPERLNVYADRYRLEQVISNLLTNAVKYGAGQPIEVKLEADATVARLVVTDRGIGIATENLARIFDRFERAVSASSISGLGLGLYISKQIVESHEGRIWVESEIGKGATFFVELPLARDNR